METLFQETLDFLRETNHKALNLQRRYDDFPRDLFAHELDFQNFIAEIVVICTGYEHIGPNHDLVGNFCQDLINAAVGRDNAHPIAVAEPIEPETTPTVEDFAALVEKHQRAAYLRRFPDTVGVLVDNACTVTTKAGKKYTKVDVGRSGKYMVVNETGEIFGVKAYSVIHRGHAYGTLDTINDWYWGEYTAYPAA